MTQPTATATAQPPAMALKAEEFYQSHCTMCSKCLHLVQEAQQGGTTPTGSELFTPPSSPPPSPPIATTALTGSALLEKPGKKLEVQPLTTALRVWEVGFKMLQDVVVKSPQIFFTFVTVYGVAYAGSKSGLINEGGAKHYTTYVTIASLIYCVTKPLLFKILPQALRDAESNRYRRLIYMTYTLGPTIYLSYLWGLKISPFIAALAWVGSFGSISYMIQPNLDAKKS